MPARPNAIPSVPINTHLPEDAHAQMTIHLYSEVDGRVPQGAYAAFLSARIREYFAWEALDLAPFLGTPPGAFVVRGLPEVISALKEKLS